MIGAYWIFYPGDFEIYHGLMQNLSREERGFDWPAYWHLDDCRKNVKFTRTYQLKEEESFTVYSHAQGYVRVNGQKKRFGETITLSPGEAVIEIMAGMVSGVPAVYVEGRTVCSDESWIVSDYQTEPVPVGISERYRNKKQNPSVWEYAKERVEPVKIETVNGGLLFDFGKELDGVLKISGGESAFPMMLCYGESRTEALDEENCYYSQMLQSQTEQVRRRAFRYVFLPGKEGQKVELTAVRFFTDIPVKASFSCENELVNRIWDTSVYTFQLCSNIFFIDGIKRDRWIWSGDAYQSYFINQYLMFDEEINRRTIWALRGNDPVMQHINTIVDYSMYWVISLYNHYMASGDEKFLRMIYPKAVSMMSFLENQLDEYGFIQGRDGDWIFIDWSEIDKDGPVCAEQMLLALCYKTMAQLDRIMGKQESVYPEKYESLLGRMEEKFWDEEKQAYIDSFTSGKRHVSRHANLFAIIYDFAEDERKAGIYRHVLCNSDVPVITTPYFKFYEMEALCKMGRREEVLRSMEAYWGGILKEGATTIWEEYDPSKSGDVHYEMYGDPYGKSLCHAWGASPVYMIGRYFMGVRPTAPGYETFEVCPDTTLFTKCQMTVPIKNGTVEIEWNESVLRVTTDRLGGTLICQGKNISLNAGGTVEIER